MKVLAIYIFRQEGVPLLSRFYDDQAQVIDGLVAPFLASISTRMEELTGSTVQEMGLAENMFLIMEQYAEIICAMVVSERKNTELELNLVARRFYKRFHKSLSGRGWKGKLDDFDDFIPEMERLLGIDPDLVVKYMPQKVLDAFIMADYDKPEQRVIREVIKTGEISVKELIEKGIDKEISKTVLKDLAEKEYLGLKETQQGEKIYFKLN